MDDQSRNLILATALSFLVLLGWFVLGPILFPDAFPPPPRRPRPPPETAPDGDRRAARRAGRRRDAGARGRHRRQPQTREAVLAQSARLPIRTARASRARSRWSAAASTTSSSPTTRSPSSPDSPMVTLLQPPGAEHAYYALYGWTPGPPLDRRRGARPRHASGRVESGEELTETHAGDAALGQRRGPRLPPDHRHRRELHVHRHPVGRERDRRGGPAQRPTASSPATACRPISRTSTSCTKASSP